MVQYSVLIASYLALGGKAAKSNRLRRQVTIASSLKAHSSTDDLPAACKSIVGAFLIKTGDEPSGPNYRTGAGAIFVVSGKEPQFFDAHKRPVNTACQISVEDLVPKGKGIFMINVKKNEPAYEPVPPNIVHYLIQGKNLKAVRKATYKIKKSKEKKYMWESHNQKMDIPIKVNHNGVLAVIELPMVVYNIFSVMSGNDLPFYLLVGRKEGKKLSEPPIFLTGNGLGPKSEPWAIFHDPDESLPVLTDEEISLVFGSDDIGYDGNERPEDME